MKKFKLFILLCVFLNSFLVSSLALAQMYKWVDKDGNISYSDQPPFKGAEQLNAPALTSVPPTKIPEKKPEETDQVSKKEAPSYSYLSITAPLNDETIRNNEGNFSITIGIKPALNIKSGDYFSVHMDGKVIQDKLHSTTASLTNIDRGTHNISIAIKDKSGKTLRKSKSVTVHLHRQSAIRRQPR